jgi:2-oxoglutarate dehydrogenase E2 component (dihydrolipoamide succinyltransferase)
MPQLGETVVEGTITRWLKNEGDSVDRDEPLFEISTDKVDTEVPSPLAGTLVKISVPEGETVGVGTEVAQIDTGDGASGDGASGSGDGAVSAGSAGAPEPEQAEERALDQQEAEQADTPQQGGQAGAEQQQEVTPPPPEELQVQSHGAEAAGQGGAVEAPANVADAAAPVETAEVAAAFGAPSQPDDGTDAAEGGAQAGGAQAGQGQAAPAGQGPAGQGPRSQILSPLVRRLAEEHGVDLSRVAGTGTGGRITKKDVEQFVAAGGERPPQPTPQPEPAPQPAPPEPVPSPVPIPQPGGPAPAPAAPAAAAGGGREEAIPLSRMRQAIAQHMVASIQTSARAWNLVEVNMANVVRVRDAAKDTFREREGIGLTYMPFVARAVCEALLQYPDVNAELRGDQLIIKRYVNLGIAVALDDGLIVPVVNGADSMNIVGLARTINDVANRARTKKLVPDDVHGGTFTITNPGPFGSIISVPIINQPQTAILAFDAVEKRPVVIDDAIAIRPMVYLSMSWDHRVIDGATAAKFLGRLKENLETWDFGPEVGLPARTGS